MPWGLKRDYGTGALHFITSSCYRRQPLLGTAERRDLSLNVLEHIKLAFCRAYFVVFTLCEPWHVPSKESPK